MIIQGIKKLLKVPYLKFKNYILNNEYKRNFEEVTVFNIRFKTLIGTFHSNLDYDDAWLFYLSKNASVIYDVGCHMGKSALLISQSKSLKKMVLIDPNPLSLSKAAENLIFNNVVQDAIFITKAAFNKSGEKIRLWTMPGPFSGASINKNFTESGMITQNYFNVETISLDDLAMNNGTYPDLVKIDVEGAEYSVLQGATEIAKKGIAFFLIEVHSCDDMSIVENTQLILNWCDSVNYKAYYLSKHIELNNTKIIEHRGRYHILLLPLNASYPQGLEKIPQGSQNIPSK